MQGPRRIPSPWAEKSHIRKFLQRIASVLERLSAVGKILEAVRGTPKFQEHCVRQARRVQESVKSTFLNADELAEVTAAISRVGFSSDVELELVTKLSEFSLEEGSSSKLQDFTMMPSYFKQSTWDKANQAVETGSEFAAQRVFIKELGAMGLRSFSCPTARILCMLTKRLMTGGDNVFF